MQSVSNVFLAGVLLCLPLQAAPVKDASSDPLARIKLRNLMQVLKSSEIQKDLALNDDQVKALEKAQADAEEAMKQAMMKAMQAIPLPAPGGAGGVLATATEDLDEVFSGPMAAFDKVAAATLKADQQKRLRQILLQIDGPHALLDRRVIRALNLSAEQEDDIEALLPRKTFSPDLDKTAKTLDTAMSAVMKVLTEDQRAKWESLIGKRLPTLELLKASPEKGLISGIQGAIGNLVPALPAVPPPPPPPPPPPIP